MNTNNNTIDIFFAADGITSTSANFIANIAKEMIAKEQAEVDNVGFITDLMMTTINDKILTTKQGDDEEMLLSLPKKIERIAQMKSLIAWLREAIKAKEQKIKEIEDTPYEDVLKLLGLEDPHHTIIKEYKEDDFIKTLSEETQRKVLLLNTKAAIYGKFIHEKGALGKARKALYNCAHLPTEVQKVLTGISIIEHTPSVDSTKVDEVFFELQDKYRKVQKELNSLRFRIKDEMHLANLERIQQDDAIQKEYFKNLHLANSAVDRWKAQEKKKIGDLKITIPQELKSIYEEVNKA